MNIKGLQVVYLWFTLSKSGFTVTVSYCFATEIYLPVNMLKEEVVWFLSLCEFSWSFGLQSWCTGSILFKETNFSPRQWRQLLELALTSANFLDHLDFRLLIFGSHSQNQNEFTVRFISRQKFIFLFFKQAVRILSLCKFSWSFGLHLRCTGCILFKGANFSPQQ